MNLLLHITARNKGMKTVIEGSRGSGMMLMQWLRARAQWTLAASARLRRVLSRVETRALGGMKWRRRSGHACVERSGCLGHGLERAPAEVKTQGGVAEGR